MSDPFDDDDLPMSAGATGASLPGFDDPEFDLDALEAEITPTIAGEMSTDASGAGTAVTDAGAAEEDADDGFGEMPAAGQLDSDLASARQRLGAPLDADAPALLALALARIGHLEISLSRPAPAESAPEAHNLLRPVLSEIAENLRAGRLTAIEAAARLEAAAEADLRALDLDDIEVDVDLGQPESGLAALAGALTGTSSGRLDGSAAASVEALTPGDPVDAALLAAVVERDALAALRIAGVLETDDRRAAYDDRLAALATAITQARNRT